MSEHALAEKSAGQLNDEMLSSMRPPTWKWYGLAFFLGAVVAWGLAAFTYQVMTDLSVTGLDRPVMWGIYIANFVFWSVSLILGQWFQPFYVSPRRTGDGPSFVPQRR